MKNWSDLWYRWNCCCSRCSYEVEDFEPKSKRYPLKMQYHERKCDHPAEMMEMFADRFEGL